MSAVAKFAAEGGPVLGICNGFQVLCEAGLLPGALLRNVELRFICKQVELLEVDGPKSAGGSASSARQPLSVPIKHGEGRYYAPEGMLDELEGRGQVAYRYADGHNSNGSVRDIAGVRSEAGNVRGRLPPPAPAGAPQDRAIRRLRVFRSLERFA